MHSTIAVSGGLRALQHRNHAINDTTDFGIVGNGLTNLPALREIGYTANRRLLHVQRLGHDPITGTDALHTITDAVTTLTGTRVPGLRLADRRSHALLQALLDVAAATPMGFANRDLRAAHRPDLARTRHPATVDRRSDHATICADSPDPAA